MFGQERHFGKIEKPRGCVTENYLQSRQKNSEHRSNDIVLIQERNRRMFYKARLNLRRRNNSGGLRNVIKKS